MFFGLLFMCEICGPYVVALLGRASLLDWYMARLQFVVHARSVPNKT